MLGRDLAAEPVLLKMLLQGCGDDLISIRWTLAFIRRPASL
jgi:hypothetical protein